VAQATWKHGAHDCRMSMRRRRRRRKTKKKKNHL
jgi:hypothetical protein